MSDSDWTVSELVEDYKAGRVSRRGFIRTLAAVGVSMPVISSILIACGSDNNKETKSSTQTGGASSPAAAATSATKAPADTFTPTKRGGGGTLKLLWWQAVSLPNGHLSTGTKEQDGSRLFYEPLASIDVDGTMVPILAAEIPSIDK